MNTGKGKSSARDPAAAGDLPYLRSLLQPTVPGFRAPAGELTSAGDPFADLAGEEAAASPSAAPAGFDATVDRPSAAAAKPAAAMTPLVQTRRQAAASHPGTDPLHLPRPGALAEARAAAPTAPQPSMPGLEELMRWVSAPRAADDAVAAAESITVELGGQGQAARAAQRVSLPDTAASVQAPSSTVTSAHASPDAAREEGQHSSRSQSAQKVSPRISPRAEPAPTQPAQAPRAEPPRPGLELHIGQISLHVQAPPASPASAPSPAAAHVATPLPAAGAPQSGSHTPAPGLRFSASRHYLRWS